MPTWKYTVLFPVTSPSDPDKAEVDELVDELEQRSNGAGALPAGYTYFGQFAIHDVSLQLSTDDSLRPVPLNQLFSLNKPALDLDSMYGQGLGPPPPPPPPPAPPIPAVPFDPATGAFVLDPAGSGPSQEKDRDLPRNGGLPLIRDPRNDENLLIAQMQVLFMRFHNRIVEDLQDSGVSGASTLFKRAKTEVVKTYQYLVLHDLTRRLVPQAVYEAVVLQGLGALSKPNGAAPTIALEFVDAACRLHSLVRPVYTINDGPRVSFERMVQLTGHKKTASTPKPLLKQDDVVDWRFFFEFANYPEHHRSERQRANALAPVVNHFMRELTDEQGKPVDMLLKNIDKPLLHGLCTGQEACDAVKQQFPDLSRDLGLKSFGGDDNLLLKKLSETNSIRKRTPLWVYLMLEAAASNRMGVLGGWIIADTFRTAALNSAIRLSDLSESKPTELYKPLKDLAQNRNRITMEDVIIYTYHQPN